MIAGGNRAGWTWQATLQGVVPPLITPLTEPGEVDEPALASLVEYVLEYGCSGLFVLGGCGEGPWLTTAQRGTVVRRAARAAAGRVPVLAGVVLPGAAAACEAARQAAAEGADALVVGAPYYYAVDDDVARRHIEMILRATDLPALLYNIPQATHHGLGPDLVAALARDPQVLGIKDSAADLQLFQRFLALRRQHPDFQVLEGKEHMMAASLLLGADGLVPGLANVAPALFVALLRAGGARDMDACAAYQERIEDLWTLHCHGHWLPALKEACAALGLGAGWPAPALTRVDDAQRQAIALIVRRHVPSRTA